MRDRLGLSAWVLALGCAVPAAPAMSQQAGTAAPATPAPVTASEQLAQANARADKAERDLEIKNTVAEIKAAQADSAMSAVENMIGAFGVLITVIVIFFALRAEQAAAAAARKEVEEAKTKIDDLLNRAIAASETAASAAEKAAEALVKAEATAQEAAGALASARTAAMGAAGEHDKARQATEEATKAQREAEAVLDNLKSNGPSQPTQAQSNKLRAAAEESAEIAEKDWTVIQFKTAIGKAMYVDKDWEETRRLAQSMARLHSSDADAVIYALNRRADAERELYQSALAIRAYGEAVARIEAETGGDWWHQLRWAMHHRAVVLFDLGRLSEAQAELEALLALAKEEGEDSDEPNTLVSRLVLARAHLLQRRTAEAKKMLSDLLPVFESAFGIEHSNTLMIRREIARAVLDEGNPIQAEKLLDDMISTSREIGEASDLDVFAASFQRAWTMLERGAPAEAEKMLRELQPLSERLEEADPTVTFPLQRELACSVLEQGRPKEAEEILRKLLPRQETLYGREHTDALGTHHVLARAILDQGRVEEARGMFAGLLPVVESVDGALNAETLITRFELARAQLEDGDAVSANETLKPIINAETTKTWLPRQSAKFLFVRARVADALGRFEDATGYLLTASELFSGCYPVDHLYRRQLDTYMSQRPPHA